MTKSGKKHVFCLESLWNENIEKKLSVLPLLELNAKMTEAAFVHLTCNTKVEFEYNLRLISRKRAYKILYLAFHGSVGRIEFPDRTRLDLEELAAIMENKFRGWAVHFGSCATLRAKDEVLQGFLERTKIGLVTGFTKNVGWAESAAFDLLLLSGLQYYKNHKYLLSHLQKTYPDMIKLNGFRGFIKS